MSFLSHKSLLHLMVFRTTSIESHTKKSTIWNMNRRTTQSSMKTNNSAEVYHRRLGSIFQCAHPTLWVCLQKLIDEENAIHVDILQICAGQPPKKKKD